MNSWQAPETAPKTGEWFLAVTDSFMTKKLITLRFDEKTNEWISPDGFKWVFKSWSRLPRIEDISIT